MSALQAMMNTDALDCPSCGLDLRRPITHRYGTVVAVEEFSTDRVHMGQTLHGRPPGHPDGPAWAPSARVAEERALVEPRHLVVQEEVLGVFVMPGTHLSRARI